MLMEAKYLEITLVMHFKCYIAGKTENLFDQTFVLGTKLFCVLCLWRQSTLKSTWLCISSAILLEKGKTCPTELLYGELNYFVYYDYRGKIP